MEKKRTSDAIPCVEEITSEAVYLNYPAKSIIRTSRLVDSGCGIYPVFYVSDRKEIFVSTSVISLIELLGSLDLNPHFRPPDFLQKREKSHAIARMKAMLPPVCKNAIRTVAIKLAGKEPQWETNWYESDETVDRRIHKLGAFCTVHSHSVVKQFKPSFSLQDPKKLIADTADCLRSYIHQIEDRFPDFQQIVLTGGKDSQLIVLVPKINQKNWHIFSAPPNDRLVRIWLDQNGLAEHSVVEGPGWRKETDSELREKIIASDCYSNPAHIRWLPELRDIAGSFSHRCIFWTGTGADAFYSFHPGFHKLAREKYFDVHANRVRSFQGNYHQTFKNFVGAALLSPYHSDDIWKRVYQHYDPSLIGQQVDLRNAIGAILAGREIEWLKENPSPEAISYPSSVDCFALYKRSIQDMLNRR
ncbi:hypothetical protein JW992_14850 [candidate division KSB1 bacterium]|nr:hypothetical protein [candidate division KSB1 bacterium]